MKTQTRIPRSIDKFNDYITNTNDYQLAGTPANYTRWEWSATESAAWTAFKTAFSPLYLKYSNKKSGRTTDVKDQLHQIIDDCVQYDKEHHLLDRIASSPDSINTDFETFNIKRGTPLEKQNKTIPEEAIQEQCFAVIRSLGGGNMRIGCRTKSDASRASKAEGADSVRVFYKIGDPASSSSDDGTQPAIFTKAAFTINCGDENVGKKLHLYTQWYNTKHPELAGPISSLQSVLIA